MLPVTPLISLRSPTAIHDAHIPHLYANHQVLKVLLVPEPVPSCPACPRDFNALCGWSAFSSIALGIGGYCVSSVRCRPCSRPCCGTRAWHSTIPRSPRCRKRPGRKSWSSNWSRLRSPLARRRLGHSRRPPRRPRGSGSPPGAQPYGCTAVQQRGRGATRRQCRASQRVAAHRLSSP
jgi:hypothetical protein